MTSSKTTTKKETTKKKSFVLFRDSLSILDELSNEQAGILFKAIKSFNEGNDISYSLDFGMKMAFIPFKNQFIRNNESYQLTCITNSGNGKKGGRPQKANKTEKSESVFKKAKKADNDNDNDNVNVNDTVKVKEKEKEKENSHTKNFSNNEKELKNSFTWLEQNCRTFRIDLPKCTIFLEQFISEQRAADNFEHRDFGDLKSHFPKWLKIQIEKEKKIKPEIYTGRKEIYNGKKSN